VGGPSGMHRHLECQFAGGEFDRAETSASAWAKGGDEDVEDLHTSRLEVFDAVTCRLNRGCVCTVQISFILQCPMI